jgi:uncharacterized protein (TIGR02453 family)
MTFRGFPDEAFEFYEGLRADNSRTYWTEHKDVYERAVREPMRALLDELGREYGEGKLFRPHRDVRFAADKSPYKTHQGGFCATADGIGYYVQIDADGLMTAAGFYAHTRERTAAYRSAVDSEQTGRALEKIVATLVRKGFTIGGDQVRTRPRGCPPDHPRLELMRHESLTAYRTVPPAELGTPAALKLVRTDWRAMKPLNDWVMTYVT